MVVDSYVMRSHIVTERAIAATDIVHLPMIDSCTFVEGDQTHHLLPILISSQTSGIPARFVDHGKSQSSYQDALSTWNLAGFQKGHLHGLGS